jgi:NAD-dependent SIR2 family protein deacetylase
MKYIQYHISITDIYHISYIIYHILEMDRLLDYIKENNPKNIVILSGAGVSTNSGIPDYRSSQNSLLKLFQKYNSYDKLKEDPKYIDLVEMIDRSKPCQSHYLAYHLYKLGKLKRVYTQNIDGLYQKAGLPGDKIIEFHGSIKLENVVLYGNQIDKRILLEVEKDFIQETDIDMVIVMGTSLKVAPFCAIPNLVPKECVRVLVDITPSNCYSNDFHSNRCISYVKFGKRRATLRQSWGRNSKYKNQHIIASDLDIFSNILIEKITNV